VTGPGSCLRRFLPVSLACEFAPLAPTALLSLARFEAALGTAATAKTEEQVGVDAP
jgi:hypothetical protein